MSHRKSVKSRRVRNIKYQRVAKGSKASRASAFRIAEQKKVYKRLISPRGITHAFQLAGYNLWSLSLVAPLTHDIFDADTSVSSLAGTVDGELLRGKRAD